MKSSLSFLFCVMYDFGIIFKKFLPNLRSCRFVLMSSSKNFIVLALKLRSLIYFWINFHLWCEGSNFILLDVDIQLSQRHFLETFFFPSQFPISQGIFVENWLIVGIWVHFWTPNFILLINTSILMLGFLDSSVGKESTCNAGDPGLIPGSGRSADEGIGYPLQYS